MDLQDPLVLWDERDHEESEAVKGHQVLQVFVA